MELTWDAVKAAVREVIEEEMGSRRAEIAPKWEGGTLLLQPADTSQKSKEIPMDTFFKKITAVRERLRVLEQKINNHKSMSHAEIAELQNLISRAYGSLTTFNVLFKEEDDRFVGQRGE